MGARLALLIATTEHQDVGLRKLTSPGADAEAFAEVLRNPDIAGFDVKVMVNEPHYRVGEEIAALYQDRRRDDLTLLYFTGHGLKDDSGRLYLAMTNTRRDSLLFTALPAEQLDHAMESCMSRQKILILDCCYSGAFPAGRAVKGDDSVHALQQFQGRGRSVLTASDSTQYSFEGDRLEGEARQSVFTHHLITGLRDGGADLDGDGDITIDELYTYIHDRVTSEMPGQRPKKQTDVEGRTVIARNVNWTLPTYLINAIKSPFANDRLGALDGLTHLHRVGNDLVRARVIESIEALAGDDSKAVSGAALASLTALRSQTPGSSNDRAAVQTQQQEERSPMLYATGASVPGRVSAVEHEVGGDDVAASGATDLAGSGPPDAPRAIPPATGIVEPAKQPPLGELIPCTVDDRGPATDPTSPSSGDSRILLPRYSCAFLAIAYFLWVILIDEPDLPPVVALSIVIAAVAGLVSAFIERHMNRRWVVAVAICCALCLSFGTAVAIKNELPPKTAGVYLITAIINLAILVVNGAILSLIGFNDSKAVFLPRRRLLFIWTGMAALGFGITYFSGIAGRSQAVFDVILILVAVGTLVRAVAVSRVQPASAKT